MFQSIVEIHMTSIYKFVEEYSKKQIFTNSESTVNEITLTHKVDFHGE